MTASRGVVSRVWRAWVDLFSAREPAFGWGVFRIGVGFCLLYSMTSISSAGLLDLLWVDVAYGGYERTDPVKILLIDLGPATPSLVNAIFSVTFVGALGVFVGIGGRPITFLTLQGYICLTNINRTTVGSDDSLLTNALWLLFLCDATRTLSLRSRLREGRWNPPAEVGAWARYLAIFQLVVVYTFAGLNKTNTHWVPWGDLNGLYRVWMDPVWLRFDMDWVAYVYPFTQLGSAVTWLFETFSFLMLAVYYCRYTRDRPGRVRAAFNRWDLRKLFLAVGASLHMGIFLTMDVGPFSLISLTFYVCLFEPTEVEATFQRFFGRLRRTPRVSTLEPTPALD
ncbi:MAG: HTTM domain-containing protein [Myxococcota bacterium]